MNGLLPLRRHRAGLWLSRDQRFTFVRGPRGDGSNGDAWHVYRGHDPEPVYPDRDATLYSAVARVRRDFYTPPRVQGGGDMALEGAGVGIASVLAAERGEITREEANTRYQAAIERDRKFLHRS